MAEKIQRWYTIKWRNLASLFLALSGIIILVSGIVLFVAPPGRYAHAVDWCILGLDKGQWEAAHTMFSFVAVIFAIIHLVINWKSLVNYLWKRTKQAYRLKRELTISILLILIIGVGTIMAWPPFSTIMDWGDVLSDAWESSYSTVIDEHDSLLAGEADITEVIDSDLAGEADLTDVNDSAIGTSDGWGRYTIAEICAQQNVTIEDALNRLASYNIDTDEEARIRIIADSNGYEPSEIVDIILGQPTRTTEDGGGE
jgi:hypothetical protein